MSNAIKDFVADWMGKGYEKGEAQPFWLSLLRDVLGVAMPEKFIAFEDKVHLDHTSFIDAYIPSTKVLIEQKSLGKNLNQPIKQSDGSFLTPFQQAKRYITELPVSKHPRWVITCNFSEFNVYDMENPHGESEVIYLKDLEKEAYRLQFLVNSENEHISKELEVSLKAGEIVGKIYESLFASYKNPESPETLHSLNILCVRLVFCLYAEDAGIFGIRNQFANYLRGFQAKDVRRALIDLFRILDTPIANRDPYEDPVLLAFPYVNGGLFGLPQRRRDAENGGADSLCASVPLRETIQIPQFTQEIVDILLHRASEDFDWSEISPTIFGAVFESTLNPETRRKGGMHYTSIENIHKVIDPLFLDDLRAEFDEIRKGSAVGLLRRASTARNDRNRRGARNDARGLSPALQKFQDKLASLTFLDPACGSGNFLTETFISLRRLENEVIRLMTGGQSFIGLEDFNPVKVSIQQFHGIEINDFAATVAKTALWIAESQMLKETEDIIDCNIDFLPLKTYANIRVGNALRMDWGSLVGSGEWLVGSNKLSTIHSSLSTKIDYIMGNPPFVGHQYRSQEQVDDMDFVFSDFGNYGKLDYVASWYKKAVDFIKGTETHVAFVSTNSLVQGESVATMWEPLFNKYGLKIDFAHRTFRWDSEASLKAHVHCVIIGFSCLTTDDTENTDYGGLSPASQNKLAQASQKSVQSAKSVVNKNPRIFDGDKVISATNINGYLLDAPNIFIKNRGSMLTAGLPKMSKGSQPTDGGNLILSEAERAEIISKHPEAESFIKRFMMGDDFINGKYRYCLWLKDVSPSVYRNMKVIVDRLEKIKELRLKSPTASVKRDAQTPMLFTQIRQPESDYLVIPRVSSEKRNYIPIGFLSSKIIAGDKLQIIPNASLLMFGMLISSVHMAWMRVTAGRLKSDYSYSPAVYNNFPWPVRDSVMPEFRNAGITNPPADAGLLRHCVPRNDVTQLCASASLREKITVTAQAILDARARYPNASLADLYDELTMPPELRKAHQTNDRAVLEAYGLPKDITELEIVAHLMGLYQKLMAKEK